MRDRAKARRRCGFTLVEVLVTAALVSIGVVGTFGAVRAIDAAQVKARTADLLQTLATEKLADLQLLQTPTANGDGGDFSDRGYSDVTWHLDDTATDVTDIDQVAVTVTQGGSSQAITALMFIRPQTTPATTPSGSAGQ